MSTKNENFPQASELSLAVMPDGREFITFEKRDGNGLGEYFIANQLGKTTEDTSIEQKNISHIIFRDEIQSLRQSIGTAYLKDGRKMKIFKRSLETESTAEESFLLAIEDIKPSDNISPNHSTKSSVRQYFLAKEDIANIEWADNKL